ncbi:hypothetical protein Ddye_017082 [Dipteronia dyeriana]|uniref:Cupin type-1 domain-containing protein n=1 Tax=Dipteronia dyeriana TaxID=168575 RepID=A0AAD9X0P1_9ROSI|nr:hypothetical protein Ddye_017082 [Dipteronia dyeriana]
MAKTILLLSLVALTFSCLAFGFEPSPLQDFCVADPTSPGNFYCFCIQNPGVITIANAVFGSNAPIASDLLAKAFQFDKKIVEQIQLKF